MWDGAFDFAKGIELAGTGEPDRHDVPIRPSARMRRALRGTVRIITAPSRGVPAFIIIGAQKSGTTSLYDYVARQTGIIPALRKEIHFFDRHFHRGVRWYRSFFPRLPPGCKTGEATPYYMAHPDAPSRMASLLPDVKLVALLRDPVDRAYSHYNHERAAGREMRTFEAAVADQWDDLGSFRAPPEKSASRWRSSAVGTDQSYLSRGLYAQQLEHWLDMFPAEQLLVLRAEDMYVDPAAAVAKVMIHIGLPAGRQMDSHPRLNSRSYEPMPAAVRARLQAFYEPHNARLSALMGQDVAW